MAIRQILAASTIRYNQAMSTDAIHYETLSGFTPLSTLGPYRAADYWKLPEGEPVELLRGRFIVSPAPDTLHQTVSILLSELLLKIARIGGGRALAAPVDVVFDDHSILQPDLLYVQKSRRGIIRKCVEGAPDMLVEILSVHNSRRDRVDKLNVYAEFGVAEYWIVDPVERQFDFLINRGGKFEVQPQQDNRYASPICPELAIELAAFWQSVDVELGSGVGAINDEARQSDLDLLISCRSALIEKVRLCRILRLSRRPPRHSASRVFRG